MSTTLRVEQSKHHFSHPEFLFGKPHFTGIQILDEIISTYLLTFAFAFVFYFSVSSLSYYVFFKWKKQKFTPNADQVREYQQQKIVDIKWSIVNICGNSLLVTLLKMTYPYYSKVQYNWNITWMFPIYLCFHFIYDQFFTYWIHRILHYPRLYGKLHQIHHKSKSVTPFSGIAFHPVDAFLQAVPLFTSCFFVPLPLDFVLAHGVITSTWAISIHDNVDLLPFKGILHASCHSIHHMPWGENYNYGKITSICDRLYGSYCDPEGVAGYGYAVSKGMGAFMNKINGIFQGIVPDFGKENVEKQARRLAKKRREAMMAVKDKQK